MEKDFGYGHVPQEEADECLSRQCQQEGKEPGGQRRTGSQAGNQPAGGKPDGDQHQGRFEEFGGWSAQTGGDKESAQNPENEPGPEYQEKVDEAGSDRPH